MPLTLDQQRNVRDVIAAHLVELEDALGPEYALTLVARHRTKPTAHIVVSVDATNDAVRRALDELDADPGQTTLDERPVPA